MVNKKTWFRKRKYGLFCMPANWKGWLVSIIFAWLFIRSVMIGLFFVPIIYVILFLIICSMKSEKHKSNHEK